MRNLARTIPALVLLCGLVVSSDRAHADAIPWSSLSRQEQEALGSYRKEWNRYPVERQNQLRNGARRYLDLDPQERQRVRRTHEEFQHLDPEERRRLRREYEQRRR